MRISCHVFPFFLSFFLTHGHVSVNGRTDGKKERGRWGVGNFHTAFCIFLSLLVGQSISSVQFGSVGSVQSVGHVSSLQSLEFSSVQSIQFGQGITLPYIHYPSLHPIPSHLSSAQLSSLHPLYPLHLPLFLSLSPCMRRFIESRFSLTAIAMDVIRLNWLIFVLGSALCSLLCALTLSHLCIQVT